ncbi:MAG: hypothetical protein JWM28_3386 [Chitinophagaceae bacterium]|nr:hypothetical protein [Chitinophagaceae bacterium]
MFKKWFIIVLTMSYGITLSAQSNGPDTSIVPEKKILAPRDDDFSDLDDITLDELESFMDSILSPNSYFLASLQLGKGYYNYESKSTYLTETAQKLTYAPVLGYFHKSGWGVNATGYIINEDKKLNLFQASAGPSFDYLKNKSFATGIAFTRFFTKDSLPFYTSPLQNEAYVYFIWRKLWIKPSVSVNYGWGSRSDYEHREDLINTLRLQQNGFTRIKTTESIKDLSVMVSARHDFYWLDVMTSNDHIRLTPQLAFTSGTQKFGFNQTSNSYTTTIRTGSNILYNSESSFLSSNTDFQPLSLALHLRGEYSIGKFFIQPQLIMDYYFPATENNFNTMFSLNAGFLF